MKIERERLGISQRDASTQAGWSAAAWGAVERNAALIDRDKWREIVGVLSLDTVDVVKRLNAFVNRYPSIWLEKVSNDGLEICERPVTSPRIIRSGKVVNVDLHPIRPALYHELSSFYEESTEVIGFAVDLNYYSAQEVTLPPSGARDRISAISEDRREHLIDVIRGLPQEKFGLIERIVDKFEKYTAKDLAQAYEHFSLSVKKR